MITGVAALLSSLVAGGALYFTSVQSEATEAQIAQSEQGQVTSRYTAAVEQLGNDALEVRLGGVYALERLARDSPRDQPTVVEVLSAYLRARLPRAGGADCPPGAAIAGRQPPPLAGDVLASLTVLSRHDRSLDQQTRVDLSDTCLSAVPGRDLGRLDFTGAVLRSVSLAGTALEEGGTAQFAGTDLRGANLTRVEFAEVAITTSSSARADRAVAVIIGSSFARADLTEVTAIGGKFAGGFERAILDRGRFDGASINRLDDASLVGTSLVAADLGGAELQNSRLTDADLTGASVRNADLRAACLLGTQLGVADARGADFTGARLSAGAVPSNVLLNLRCLGKSPADVTRADLRGALGIDLSATSGTPAFGPGG